MHHHVAVLVRIDMCMTRVSKVGQQVRKKMTDIGCAARNLLQHVVKEIRPAVERIGSDGTVVANQTLAPDARHDAAASLATNQLNWLSDTAPHPRQRDLKD